MDTHPSSERLPSLRQVFARQKPTFLVSRPDAEESRRLWQEYQDLLGQLGFNKTHFVSRQRKTLATGGKTYEVWLVPKATAPAGWKSTLAA